jgi:PAS domain S-box-containing protein
MGDTLNTGGKQILKKEILQDWREENIYKLIVENMNDEITIADRDGKYVYVNQMSTEIIGAPATEIIGKNARDLVSEGYFQRSVVTEVLKTGEQADILQKMRNGNTIIATGIPIFNADRSEILLVIATTKNVDDVNDLLAQIADRELKLSMKDTEIEKLRDELFTREGFIFADPTMRNVSNAIMRMAPLDVTVLIEGETGVGKEVVAHALHQFSGRVDQPFMKVNCGILPSNLIESELFGYERGSFTGARHEGKKGLVEIAERGTLFLDEIGEMPLDMQVKLLDLIQDGMYKPIGGTEYKKSDTRIIAATNRDLRAMCADGEFRKDLFYRLSVMPLMIPPLRDRTADIAVLAKHFLSKCNKKYKVNKSLSEEAFKALESYSWLGNVRELQNIIERVCVFSEGNIICSDEISRMIENTLENVNNGAGIVCMGLMPLKEARDQVDRMLVSQALRMHKTTYKAAEALGVNQSTIVKLSKKYNQQ